MLPPADGPRRPDAVPDVPPPPPFCPSDSHLRLCYSFDQPTLGDSLPNEGAAAVNASLTNVRRIARGAGGAAGLDMTSVIRLPYTSEISGIQAVEVWYRADVAPTNEARMGLVDNNVLPPNISFFVARVDPTYQLRCGLGGSTSVANAKLEIGTWYYVACVCESGFLRTYVNGEQVGEANAGACATGGGLVENAGLTIGSNNNGASASVNDWLVGAIDGVRLWDIPLPAERIEATAAIWP